MRNGRSDVLETAMKKIFKQRIFMIIGGLALFFASYYGHGITIETVNVLKSMNDFRRLFLMI